MENTTQEYTQFLTEIEKTSKQEEKVRLALDFMKGALSSDSTPNFRDFWDAKRLCLDLFKEKIPARLRTVFWAEYIELSEEIRKVKEILDENASFAKEQIELAISALKDDVEAFDERLEDLESIEVPQVEILEGKEEFYIEKQKELSLLNNFAGRANSLRKELIQTEMRIRNKNRLFEKLSKLGDGIFPRRKEAVKTISEGFLADIEKFVFDEKRAFAQKEEIKGLQSFAKTLALNAATFSQARERLSGFWDQIKQSEKEQHQKKAQEREKYRENFELFLPKIEDLKECEKLEEAEKKEAVILEEMRATPLGKEEVQDLKKKLRDAKAPLERKQLELLEKQREAEKREKERKLQAQQNLLDQLGELLDHAESLPADKLVEKWDALVKEEKALKTEGLEKERIVLRLETIADQIQEKKWQDLKEKNSEEVTHELHELLDERHKARRKCKETLESHRKVVGGSGLSLEQSLLYQEMIGDEKIRLDAIETIIEELEEKLFDMEE